MINPFPFPQLIPGQKISCTFCEKLHTGIIQPQVVHSPTGFYYKGCQLDRSDDPQGHYPWSRPELAKFGCGRGPENVFQEQGLFFEGKLGKKTNNAKNV